MKKYILLLVSVMVTVHSEEFHLTGNTLAERSADLSIEQLVQPVDFSKTGITYFFQHIFNHPDYGLQVLPNTFAHLEQFLMYGKRTNQDRSFVKSTFRLFCNKIKSSLYVNAFSFDQFLQSLPDLVQSQLPSLQNEQAESIKEELKTLLYDRFFVGFEEFKADPEDFFSRLSDDIVKTVDHQTEERRNKISVAETRKAVLLFLELCTHKLIWDPQDELKTWESVKKLSQQYATLLEVHILNSADELSDLFCSLVDRYCIFLELMQGDLSIKFFTQLKESVTTESLPLLDLADQEEQLETRRARLLRVVQQGEAHARAREYGYTTLEERTAHDTQKLEVVVKDSKRKRRRRQRGKSA